MNNAVLVKTSGDVFPIENTSLKGLEIAMDSKLFQAVYLRVKPFFYEGRHYDIMLVDDDGHNRGLWYNKTATDMYHENTKPNDHSIVGDVIFTTNEVWN